MQSSDAFYELLHDPKIGRADKVLLALHVIDRPASVSEILASLKDGGIRGAAAWNVSQILARSRGTAAPSGTGWRLLSAGRDRVQALLPAQGTPRLQIANGLRKIAEKIGAGVLHDFVMETVQCVEQKTWRAAIVLSWVGAVWHLQQLVFAAHLSAFNAAAAKRFPKSKPIQTMEDFSRFGEADFLQLCEDIGFLSKSAKKLLGQRLDLRNAAGHPNSIQLDEEQVIAHVSFLINNAYSRS